ncbi:MOSC domain containing protein [Planctopirus limnophila DSM 3776]|uniref:MOSC domain containing protein n=1 Tax=Planctopirus limnophila (strain ATCC 43296 / DSM 3776 / IFAM 1008 / Mu 290) TaxID=521674 RepID=D5SS04_PLAL2|nr:MOSC domain-containing protein [Planctopirus limnophila]ADG68728.1 MOSC domain containing protein [Planctopirus limnophila DSM 3776]
MRTIAELMQILPQTGTVRWMGLSSARRSNIVAVEEVLAIAGYGLEGDHHAKRRPDTKRQVTLIQAEHLVAVAGLMQIERLDPALVRRNFVVSGINLLALKGQTFQVGEAIFEGTGSCDPCSRMEENLGPGGYNAMRGHGGLTAKVHTGGKIRLGDEVRLLQTGHLMP